MQTLQERISESLRRAGMRPADLARRAGVKRATVSLWLNGPTKTLSGENLTRAAQALNVDAHWLSTGEGRPDPDVIGLAEPAAPYGDEKNLLEKYRALRPRDRERILRIIDVLRDLSKADR